MEKQIWWSESESGRENKVFLCRERERERKGGCPGKGFPMQSQIDDWQQLSPFHWSRSRVSVRVGGRFSNSLEKSLYRGGWGTWLGSSDCRLGELWKMPFIILPHPLVSTLVKVKEKKRKQPLIHLPVKTNLSHSSFLGKFWGNAFRKLMSYCLFANHPNWSKTNFL